MSMRITGKISEENLICITMLSSNAATGLPKSLWITIEMVAKMSTDASTHTDGRNLSIILKTSNLINVKMEKSVQSLTVPIIIQNKISDNNCNRGLGFFRKPAQSLFHQIITCHI